MEESSKKAQKMAWIIIGLIIVIGVVLVSVFVILPNVKGDDEDKSEVSSSKESKSKSYTDSVTEDFEISGYMSLGKKIQYSVYIESEDDEEYSYQDIEINAKDYNLPSNLYEFKDDILLRVTYSSKNYEVYDCVVLDSSTKKEIEDISEENIEKLYSIEYGKTIIEKDWIDTINISTLKENEIYKFTSKKDSELPKIVNDTEKNYVVYTKDYEDGSYEKEIYMANKLSSDSLSYSSYESDVYYVMCQEVKNKELLELIKDDELINLSDYKNGDELDYVFEEYIYNDNQFPVNLIIEEGFWDDKKTTETVTIGAGEIWGFDWMIDSVKVEY